MDIILLRIDINMEIESPVINRCTLAYQGLSVSKKFDNFAVYDTNTGVVQISNSECYYASIHDVYKLRKYSVYNIYRAILPHLSYKYMMFDISSNEVHMSNYIEIGKNSYVHYKLLCYCNMTDIINLAYAIPINDISELYEMDTDNEIDEDSLELEMNRLSIKIV